jgi:hypothetical protein
VIGLSVALIGSVDVLKGDLSASGSASTGEPGLIQSVNPNLVQVANGGFGSFIGSIAWVSTVFEYSSCMFDGKTPRNLPPLFSFVSWSDTDWDYPRLVAAWVLPELPGFSTRTAVPFLEEGARRFPTDYRFNITWAQYVLSATDIDSSKARDSAAAILLPLASTSSSIPQYARNLAFTLLHKNGKPEEAMSLLLKTYEQVPDPMVRYQFRGKIGDLLWRNRVDLGRDSANFLGGIGALLESKDPAQERMAKELLVGLVDTARRDAALPAAHQLARQYAAYSAKK